MAVLRGHWGILTGDLEDIVILDVMDDLILPHGRHPESFILISLLELFQEWGALHGGIWRTLRVPDQRLGQHGHLWCHGWSYFTPRKISWKFPVDIIIWSMSRMGSQEGGVLGGRWGFLTGDMEEMVILDFMDDLILPKEKYPESFVLIFLLKVCQEWGVLQGGTWRTLRVPDRTHEEHGHPWCHGWSYFTPRKIPWKFHV